MNFYPFLDNVFNSSNPQPETQTPSPHQSPQYSSEHTPSPKYDKTLSISHVMSSSKPTSEFDIDEPHSHTISQMLLNFNRQEPVHREFILEVLTSHLGGVFTTEKNQLVLYSDPDQPNPINTMFESPYPCF